MKVKDRTKERSVKKSYNETNKHEKAKKNFFNEKQPKGNKGYQLRTLDELLNEQVITDKFSADGAFYLRTVLTNQKSYNIRNMLCHGIANPNNFGVVAADRLLHILYLVTTI